MAEIAHRAGALLVCDNTWSPIIQRPFALGADLVMHSTTKYFGGHSDVLGGALIAQRDDEFFQRLREIQSVGGAVPGSVRLLAGASRYSDAALPDARALRKRAAGGGSFLIRIGVSRGCIILGSPRIHSTPSPNDR